MEPLGYHETSVTNYHYTPRNFAEERRFHVVRGGSLMSRVFILSAAISYSSFRFWGRSVIIILCNIYLMFEMKAAGIYYKIGTQFLYNQYIDFVL